MSHPDVRLKKGVALDTLEIDPAVLVSVPSDLLGFTERRLDGEFAQKALYLNHGYIWVFGFDNVGALVAIPTRRY